MAVAKLDENSRPTLTAVSNVDASTVVPLYADPTTHRLLVDLAGGSGTVTSVSVVSANGFAGTVATATTTPAITISTTINSPVLAGNGTAISAATTTGSGSTVVLNNSPVFVDDITVGVAASATGSILFKGLTSGTVTLSVADVAGTWTMKLPTSAGSNTNVLQTDGAGNTSWVAAGTGDVTKVGTPVDNQVGVWTGDGTIEGTVALNFSAGELSVGTDATTLGKLKLYGNTSGDVTIQPNAVAGTGIVLTAPATTGTIALTSQLGGNITVGTTTITSGTTTRILYDNAGVLGEYTLTGSGTVVVMQTAPTFVTSITTPSVLATANDSGALGASGTAFSDLFLASGAVINFNAGNVTLTHSAGILTQNAGEFRITSANVGTNADSVPTLSSTSTFTNKTLTSPTITTATLSGAQQLAEGASIKLDQTLSADGTYSGTTIAGTAGAALAFGDVVYLAAADSRWELADASAASTSGSVLVGFCVLAAAADGDPTTILLDGNIRADTAFPALTVSAPVYISETAGDIVTAQPTTTDAVIRVMGFALTADSIVVKISPDYITHT